MERQYRETSRLAWADVKEQALMVGSHFDLYTIVVANPDITAAEATQVFNNCFGTNLSRNEIAKRMSNLRYNYKVVDEVGERACTVNGKLTISYIANNALPAELPKKKKSKNKIIEELQARIQELENERTLDEKPSLS